MVKIMLQFILLSGLDVEINRGGKFLTTFVAEVFKHFNINVPTQIVINSWKIFHEYV